MKDSVLRALFMVGWFGAFFAIGELHAWVKAQGISEATEMTVVVLVCFVLPVVGLLAWAAWETWRNRTAHESDGAATGSPSGQ